MKKNEKKYLKKNRIINYFFLILNYLILFNLKKALI